MNVLFSSSDNLGSKSKTCYSYRKVSFFSSFRYKVKNSSIKLFFREFLTLAATNSSLLDILGKDSEVTGYIFISAETNLSASLICFLESVTSGILLRTLSIFSDVTTTLELAWSGMKIDITFLDIAKMHYIFKLYPNSNIVLFISGFSKPESNSKINFDREPLRNSL